MIIICNSIYSTLQNNIVIAGNLFFSSNEKEKQKKIRFSHLFVDNFANVCVDSREKIVHAFRGLSGEIELTVDLHRFVHIAKRDVEHVIAFFVAEKRLVHP